MSFSPWVILGLTYERYVGIVKPFEAKDIATRTNICKWLLLTFLCLCSVNIPKILYSQAWYQLMFDADEINITAHKSCQITSYTAAWIDFISRCLLPFTILLVYNIIIICTFTFSNNWFFSLKRPG